MTLWSQADLSSHVLLRSHIKQSSKPRAPSQPARAQGSALLVLAMPSWDMFITFSGVWLLQLPKELASHLLWRGSIFFGEH